jgi:hypothetical protein
VRVSLRAGLVFALVASLAPRAVRAERGAPAAVAFRDEGGRVTITVRGGTSATIARPSPTLALVHVVGAKAPRRIDRLPLDASAFRGPVARVEVRAVSGGVDLRVHVAKGATIASREAEGAIALDVAGAEGATVGAPRGE